MQSLYFPKRLRRRRIRWDPIEILAGLIWRCEWPRS